MIKKGNGMGEYERMTQPMSQDDQKKMLARRAVELVEPGMVLGLGTGSTVDFFIRELARKDFAASALTIVPTSRGSAGKAETRGLKVVTPTAEAVPDLCIDGADEVSRDLSMTKGGGGALLWEKIVARASRRRVYLADDAKLVARLGKFPLPVEVVPFGHEYSDGLLRKLGAETRLRTNASGAPFETDSGNLIYDCTFSTEADPAMLDADLSSIPGVVTSGLFIGYIDSLLTISDGKVVSVSNPADVFW